MALVSGREAFCLADSLRYTICFVCHKDQVLLLRRRFPPLAGLLNGVGGKLEPGEAPLACVLREVAEETGIALPEARFGGVVTWAGHTYEGKAGMYAYTAQLPPGTDPDKVAGETEEGALAWYPIAQALGGDLDVVSNIPGFLRPMLAGAAPAEYHLSYEGDRLLGQEILPLPG
ncbi:MAG: 8-oxo-dGTP diphosphatase [Symbiobacteriaceae bacterium]|jgi:8-oxo-dGTP diphosphatase|nr:8-oxo-dGTP diphosphatase [Symbiobacteriaceae bacterium]